MDPNIQIVSLKSQENHIYSRITARFYVYLQVQRVWLLLTLRNSQVWKTRKVVFDAQRVALALAAIIFGSRLPNIIIHICPKPCLRILYYLILAAVLLGTTSARYLAFWNWPKSYMTKSRAKRRRRNVDSAAILSSFWAINIKPISIFSMKTWI